MTRQDYHQYLIKYFKKTQLAEILALAMYLLDYDATNNTDSEFAEGWRKGRDSMKECINSELKILNKHNKK